MPRSGRPWSSAKAAEPVIAAWLAHLADDPALPGIVAVAVGARGRPVRSGARRHPGSCAVRCGRFQSPPPRAPCAARRPSSYIERALGRESSRRCGALRGAWPSRARCCSLPRPNKRPLRRAIEDSSALEASGWKGRPVPPRPVMTNPLLHHAGHWRTGGRRQGLDQPSPGRRSRHRSTITLRSGGSAWFWKIAYDEQFARYSPGVMLTVAVTEELADDATIARTDSCATADHPMIDHIWRERLTLCDRLVAVRPEAPFAYARRAEALRRTAVSAARRPPVVCQTDRSAGLVFRVVDWHLPRSGILG